MNGSSFFIFFVLFLIWVRLIEFHSRVLSCSHLFVNHLSFDLAIIRCPLTSNGHVLITAHFHDRVKEIAHFLMYILSAVCSVQVYISRIVLSLLCLYHSLILGMVFIYLFIYHYYYYFIMLITAFCYFSYKTTMEIIVFIFLDYPCILDVTIYILLCT